MGVVLSYITQKTASVEIESELSASPEAMAESNQYRDSEKREYKDLWLSQDDINRYSSALHNVHEFLTLGEKLIGHQRMLEADLQTCHER